MKFLSVNERGEVIFVVREEFCWFLFKKKSLILIAPNLIFFCVLTFHFFSSIYFQLLKGRQFMLLNI